VIFHFRVFIKNNQDTIFIVMADGITYGINFPFRDSVRGDYLELTQFESEEIKADLIHLLLTRKGSRYYLPNFGTRLYEFLFEPFDGLTFDAIESDIRDAVATYMPNLLLNQITISPADPTEEADLDMGITTVGSNVASIYRFPGKGTSEYTAKIKIDYSTSNNAFGPSDFIIINI
jgi:phage baseplate assembly protein W